MNDIKID